MSIRRLFEMPEDARGLEVVKARQEIQAAIIRKTLPEGSVIDEYAMEWIREHSEDFGLVYNDLANEYPNLLHMWQEEPERVIALVEERLQNLAGTP